MRFAKRTDLIKSSDTRDLLNVIGFEEMISFAGGLPNAEGFPYEALKEAAISVFENYGYSALQYGPTEGVRELRSLIGERLTQRFGQDITVDNILITSGGQQALDILGKVFLDENDAIFMEEPTYFSAINVFKAYYPIIKGLETDDEGVKTPILASQLEKRPDAKFCYYIPDYQNPSGKTWSEKRKRAVLDIHRAYQVPIIEDCPYSELAFDQVIQPSFYELSGGKDVVHIGSFSKTFCPGFRLGYILAEKAVIKKCVLMKQSMDLHTSSFSQMMLLEYMRAYGLDTNIEKVKSLYMHKRDMMIKALEKYLPNAKYTLPKGGMFLWVDLGTNNDGLPYDSRLIYEKALKSGVAFVAGDAFYIDSRQSSGLRLNYTNTSDELIDIGILRIAKLLD